VEVKTSGVANTHCSKTVGGRGEKEGKGSGQVVRRKIQNMGMKTAIEKETANLLPVANASTTWIDGKKAVKGGMRCGWQAR